nr:hypothetical protein [Tanacetum cinerariifolium]
MATTIEQQTTLDESLVPSTQRAFQVTANVPEIYMQEFWATAKLHHNSIRFKIDTRKSVLDLEAFREMLHISLRIPNQPFADLPTEEEILDFLRFLGHTHDIRYLTDVNVNKPYQHWRSFASVINKCLTGKISSVDSFRLSQAQMLWGFYHRINIDFAYLIWEDFVYQVEHKNQKRSNEINYPRFTKVIIDYFMTRKPSISRRNRINWHYVRDDALFSTIKVVSRHQKTQQYGAILPIELTTDEIRNSKAYKEYHACAMGEAAPKPKASARKKKGDSASSTTPPTPTPTTTVESAPWLSATAKGKQPSRATTPVEPIDVQRTEAEQLKIVLRKSRQETHISQQRGSGIDEGTDVGGHEEGKKSDESDDDRDEGSDDDSDEIIKAGAGKDDDDDDDEDDDDNDEEEELAKDDEEDKESGKGGDEVRESGGKSDEEETRQEEDKNFDPIPRTPKESEEESNDEEDQDLRLSEEARIQEEEDTDELYRDVNINQGRGLQVTQNVEDTHVTLTPVNPDGPQESSSMSSFVSSMLNPINDVGVKSIFTTTSSLIVSLETLTPIMTLSTIATITTSSEAPVPPPTIPSIILENLLMFNSAFLFEERLRSLETSFSEYRQTNPFADAVSAIPGIEVSRHQLALPLKKQSRVQADLQQGLNLNKCLLVSPAFAEEPVQTTCQMEETLHPVFDTADLSKMELKKILIEKMEGNKSIQRSDEQQNLYKAKDGRMMIRKDPPLDQTGGLKDKKKEPRRPPSSDHAWNTTLPAAQGDAQSWISDLARQTDARSSFNELLDTPIDFSNFIMHWLNEVYKATTDQLDWVNPEGQQYLHNLLQPLLLIPNN